MPSVSQNQQRAAGAALAAQRGEIPKRKLWGAAKSMAKMDPGELRKFAKTKHQGLPAKKHEDLIQQAVRHLLSEDEGPAEEQKEVHLARNIMNGLRRLQASLPDPTPEQLRALTTARSAAHELLRMHA